MALLGDTLRPTMLKLGASPNVPSPFWLLVVEYAPGPGIESHSYGLFPLSAGMGWRQADSVEQLAERKTCRGAKKDDFLFSTSTPPAGSSPRQRGAGRQPRRGSGLAPIPIVSVQISHSHPSQKE